jgi:hypothetical protein
MRSTKTRERSDSKCKNPLQARLPCERAIEVVVGPIFLYLDFVFALCTSVLSSAQTSSRAFVWFPHCRRRPSWHSRCSLGPLPGYPAEARGTLKRPNTAERPDLKHNRPF